MARRIAETATEINPELLLYFNGVSYEDQQEIGTYLEFECLPTGGWGYEPLPLYGRYLRNLGKPLLNMTGRFHRAWADFGGIRTEASLAYDVYHGLALGMRTTIGDHFHPRGDINTAVFDLIARVYGQARTLEPWLEDARPLAEIALIAPEPGGFSELPTDTYPRRIEAMMGACRMLCDSSSSSMLSVSAYHGMDITRSFFLITRSWMKRRHTEYRRTWIAAGRSLRVAGPV